MKYINDIYTDKAYHWLFFLKENNLSFLRLDALKIPASELEQDGSDKAMEAYHNINDQIIQSFGIEKSFLIKQELKRDIAKLKLRFIIKEDKSKRTEYRIREAELDPVSETKVNDSDLSDEISLVSKNLGIAPINIKEYTIHQYLMARKQ